MCVGSVCGYYVYIYMWFVIFWSKGGYDVYKYMVGLKDFLLYFMFWIGKWVY